MRGDPLAVGTLEEFIDDATLLTSQNSASSEL